MNLSEISLGIEQASMSRLRCHRIFTTDVVHSHWRTCATASILQDIEVRQRWFYNGHLRSLPEVFIHLTKRHLCIRKIKLITFAREPERGTNR